MNLHPLAPRAEIEAARRITLAKNLPPAALAALDEITRPLTLREIEAALHGVVSKSQRQFITHALRGFAIVAIVPPLKDSIDGR